MSSTARHPGHPDLKVHRLRPDSIGVLGIMFLLIGATSPLLAILGNVPIEVSAGNGIYAPGGYIVWIVGLLVFVVGYAAMARRMVSTGGFYSYISHGLGRPAGLAAGWSALAAYAIGEAGLFGGLGYFAANTFSSQLGIHLSWVVYGAVALAIVTFLSYRDIRLSTKVLGMFGVVEVLILLLVDVVVIAHGGASGFTVAPLDPAKAFSGPSPTVGLMFAFLSWVGFEMVPNYAEETSNPTRNTGRGLYVGVIGLGALFILSAWAGVIGNGVNRAVGLATSNPVNFYFTMTTHFVGSWATTIMEWLIVTSTFAACLVWHQTTSRYFYVLGREGVGQRLGRTHDRHKSPHVAVLFQTGIVVAWGVLFIIFYYADKSARSYAGNFATAPYVELFAWLLVATTLFILANEFLCSIAVIGYFRHEPRSGWRSWFQTLIAPAFATILLGTMLVVAVTHVGTLGGNVSFVKAIPAVCIAWILLGLGLAFWLRARRPETYERLGSLVESLGARKSPSRAAAADGIPSAAPVVPSGMDAVPEET
ncbi:MAG: APC family permease [Actinomycetota bacterium]|nr:APC family permease [Actinomycetota bacterium]